MPPTRSAVAIDPALLAAIKQAVRDEITTELTEIRKALKSLVEINQRLEDVERGLQFTSERLNSAIKDIFPSMGPMTQGCCSPGSLNISCISTLPKGIFCLSLFDFSNFPLPNFPLLKTVKAWEELVRIAHNTLWHAIT